MKVALLTSHQDHQNIGFFSGFGLRWQQMLFPLLLIIINTQQAECVERCSPAFVSGLLRTRVPFHPAVGALRSVSIRGRSNSPIDERTQRRFAPRRFEVRSALGSSELTHVLKEYGVPALLTHAVGWGACMTLVFSALSNGLGTDTLVSYLPEGMQAHFTGEGAGSLVRLQLSLAATEAVGPARVALTLAITPRVSALLRSSAAGRNVEAFFMRKARWTARSVNSARVEVMRALPLASLTKRHP